MHNFASAVRESVESQPKAIAIEAEGRELTYRELWIRASQFAGGLREHDVKAGDVVAIALPNGIERVVSILGALRNGSVVVPVPTTADLDGTIAVMEDCDADIAVVPADLVTGLLAGDHSFRAIVRVGDDEQLGFDFESFTDTAGLHDFWEVIARDATDPAVVLYGGRRTDPDVGVVYTNETVHWNVETAVNAVPGGLTADDTQVDVLPGFHAFSLVPVLFATLVSGGTYVPVANTSIEDTLERLVGDVTVFHAVAQMYQELAGADGFASLDASNLRVAGCLGGPFPSVAHDGLIEAGCTGTYQSFGQTETGPIALWTDELRGGGPDLLGRPVEGIEIRILDEDGADRPPVTSDDPTEAADGHGELVVAGEGVTDGYHERPALDDERFVEIDGERWVHTGVEATVDEDGRCYRVDPSWW